MARILAIDADADALLLTAKCLRGAGHEVATGDDSAAVEALAAKVAYDALVLDLDPPGLAGLEVLRLLRRAARTRGLPVLLLSSRGESADRVRGLREGADDFLVKPFDPDELVLRVERLVAARSARGELAGDLETYPLWNLLQSLARSRRSGTILAVSAEKSAELFLSVGRLVEARVGGLRGEEAMIAALDFVRGSFRFFEGDLLEGVAEPSWEGLDGASLVLRHAWLLDEARRGEAPAPGYGEPFTYLDPGAFELPSRLDSPAVHALLEQLHARLEITRDALEALEIAAPLTVEALLAHLAGRRALRPLPTL